MSSALAVVAVVGGTVLLLAYVSSAVVVNQFKSLGSEIKGELELRPAVKFPLDQVQFSAGDAQKSIGSSVELE